MLSAPIVSHFFPVWWKTDNKFNLITLAPHQTTQIPYLDPGETDPPRQGSRLICTQTRNKEEKEAEEEERGRMSLPVCPLSLAVSDPCPGAATVGQAYITRTR